MEKPVDALAWTKRTLDRVRMLRDVGEAAERYLRRTIALGNLDSASMDQQILKAMKTGVREALLALKGQPALFDLVDTEDAAARAAWLPPVTGLGAALERPLLPEELEDRNLEGIQFTHSHLYDYAEELFQDAELILAWAERAPDAERRELFRFVDVQLHSVFWPLIHAAEALAGRREGLPEPQLTETEAPSDNE
jgi:hypothetical protein